MSEIKLEETPTLTFEPFKEESQLPVEEPQKQMAEAAPALDDSMLSDEEKQMVKNFAAQIDIANSAQVLQYGAGAQQKVASFSEKALENVRTKDLGEVGDMITGVVTELKNFDAGEEEKGLFGFFKKNVDKLTTMKTKYQKAETNVNHIVEALEQHQVTLMKDVATLDQLYELNKTYYKELTMYILAGKQKLNQVENVDIPALAAKAQASGLPEDAQAVSDLTALANRFEKKLHDLKPQIRLVQNNDTMMSDKIQSTIVNTIPLWKSQMVIALGVAHSEQAAKVQREVSDFTNEMLKKNAERLKTVSVNVAKESERGIVDIETLQTTNEQLISTLDEVLQIQKDGRAKRQAAEVELQKIEGDLKAKLLSMRSSVQG